VQGHVQVVGVVNLRDVDFEGACAHEPEGVVDPADVGRLDAGFVKAIRLAGLADHEPRRPFGMAFVTSSVRS
jgi:hypothetical protein